MAWEDVTKARENPVFATNGSTIFPSETKVKKNELTDSVLVRNSLRLLCVLCVAIHFGTFALGDDGESEPVAKLRASLNNSGASSFWVLEQGEGRNVP